MKIIKTANRKLKLKLSRKEWKDLGKQAGWLKRFNTEWVKYVQDEIDNVLKRYGAYLFSDLNQADTILSDKSEEYGNYGNWMGKDLIAPKSTAPQLIQELDALKEKGIQLDIQNNGVEAIIKRELDRQDCYSKKDISDCVEELKPYNIPEQEIGKVFWDEYRARGL